MELVRNCSQYVRMSSGSELSYPSPIFCMAKCTVSMNVMKNRRQNVVHNVFHSTPPSN